MGLFSKKKNIRFPFSDAPNTACFTCCHVLNKEKPILYVSHDEDGYWEFLCNGNHTEDDARVVSLNEIFEINKGISDLARMDCGYYAEAKDEMSNWVVKKITDFH